jgi:hypothetical protein
MLFAFLLFCPGFGCHKLASFECTSCPVNTVGLNTVGSNVEVGCKCKPGYTGSIVSKASATFLNGAYDGSCYPSNEKCGINIGFNANPVSAVTKGSGWHEWKNWKVAGNRELYNTGNSFTPSLGRFAPPTGYYLCSSQVRIDSFSSSYSRMVIAINGNTDVNNGMHAIEGDYGDTNYRFHSVSGVIKINAGQWVSVWINSVNDNSWMMQTESGFSCHMLKSAVGFHADKNGNLGMKTNWKEVRPAGPCVRPFP